MAFSKISPLLLIALLQSKYILTNAQDVLDNPESLPYDVNDTEGWISDNDENWGYLYLAGFGISVIGMIFSFLFLSSVFKSRMQEYKLKRLVLTIFAFAIGAILGTTVVILLPKAFGVEITKWEVLDGTDYYRTLTMDTEINSLIILGAFGFFFILDLFTRHALTKPKEAKRDGVYDNNDSIQVHENKHNVVPNVVVGTGQNYGTTNVIGTNVTGTNAMAGPTVVNNPNYNVLPNNDIVGNTNIVGQPNSYPQHNYGNPNLPNVNLPVNNVPVDHRGSTEISPRDRMVKPLSLYGTRKQTVLIILRQMLYNYFSGMAIGAAFGTESKRIVVCVSIAILIQEIPFEIADTILLYYSGMSFKNAMLYNVLWNLVPTAIGLSMGRALAGIDLEAAAYIFAACVGAFLYVAASNIMAAIVKERKGGMKANYVIASIIGAGVMFAVLQIEE